MRAWVITVLVLGLLGGCIFEPRQPEGEPGAPCFVPVIASQDPLQVIFNMDGSLECAQPSDYTLQVSENFVFIPAPSVAANHPDLFPSEDSWGKVQESAFVSTFLSTSGQEVESSLLLRQIERSGTSEVQIEAEYVVTVSADGSQLVYTGEAFYTFRQENTVWILTRWREKEADNPLGALKAELVSGR
jgi:hypothetical protein